MPKTTNKTHDWYFNIAEPRKNFLSKLEKQLSKQTFQNQVWISFVGDVYGDSMDDNLITRETLKLLNHYKIPVCICTKNPQKMLRDLGIIKQFDDRIIAGTTLTFFNENKSKFWEPNANLSKQRIEALKILHENDIKTHASFEPCIEPEESLKIMKESLPYVDHYKVGILNHNKTITDGKDWENYLNEVLAMLRPLNKEIYVKNGLRRLTKSIELSQQEKDCDFYAL
ncbi:MAG: hypothetical protein LBU60_05505 [Clostridiales bacterium]|nr:hypothetical protein [Clostridiales bacterium]